MVGPSSSHTAGAARIAAVTRKLLGEDVKYVINCMVLLPILIKGMEPTELL